jgi:hypothetical protein
MPRYRLNWKRKIEKDAEAEPHKGSEKGAYREHDDGQLSDWPEIPKVIWTLLTPVKLQARLKGLRVGLSSWS